MDGDLLLGVALGDNKLSREDIVLVIDHNPYDEIDEWVTYKGQESYADMDLFTASGRRSDLPTKRLSF